MEFQYRIVAVESAGAKNRQKRGDVAAAILRDVNYDAFLTGQSAAYGVHAFGRRRDVQGNRPRKNCSASQYLSK